MTADADRLTQLRQIHAQCPHRAECQTCFLLAALAAAEQERDAARTALAALAAASRAVYETWWDTYGERPATVMPTMQRLGALVRQAGPDD